MKILMYQVDAFTSQLFRGNPAAVCPLEAWPDDTLLQNIAAENNLSETAFFVKAPAAYELRWFTPVSEVDLCGHATLATAFVLFNELKTGSEVLNFDTRSGRLTVRKDGDWLQMDFPVYPPQPFDAPPALVNALGKKPSEIRVSKEYFAVYETEEAVRTLAPDFNLLKSLELPGVIVTAPGREVDFVSRMFVPKLGIDEDPVTGSAHSILAPFWAERLEKTALHARQVSRRGGELRCDLRRDRVVISGQAVKYLEGTIEV